MPPQILDTHIHLWPSTALTSKNHAWMTDPSHILTKRHGISDYLHIAPSATGFIYVETDRYLPSPAPASDDGEALRTWAKEALSEISFLRRVIEGKAHEESDGVKNGEQGKMKGVVLFAPFHLSPSQFKAYLHVARETAGPDLWRKVVGFRYLLQGKGEGVVEELVKREEWVSNILELGKSSEYGGKEGGWVFEVGADVNRDGISGLQAIVAMIGDVRKRESAALKPVRFVLNHLCKHPLTHPPSPPSPEYVEAIKTLGQDENVYMKLSGAFNEFTAPSKPPNSIAEMVDALTPVLDQVFAGFSGRIMFGSDWPVCNVGGPAGEDKNWGFWRDIVSEIGQRRGLSDDEMSGIWNGVGKEVYGIDL